MSKPNSEAKQLDERLERLIRAGWDAYGWMDECPIQHELYLALQAVEGLRDPKDIKEHDALCDQKLMALGAVMGSTGKHVGF